jgi:ATP-dependent RNA helicase DeaD
MPFKKFGLNESIVKAITELGFLKPTEIQQETIPLLINADRDFIGLAQTGTGKTAAFGLPLLHTIDVAKNVTQALILCPTRELCLQISTELIKYGKYSTGLNIVPIYGGTDIRKQMMALKKGAHIVVGTPGRILDHLDRRTLDLKTIDVVVLDEADEMLTMGFQEDINAILGNAPKEKRTWLFSATMPPMVESISKQYMVNPATVTIGSKNGSAQNITHVYCVTRRHDRYQALRRFIDFYPEFFGLVFCKTRLEAKEISDKLMQDGYNADALHGDLSQGQRDTVMQKLRRGKLRIVIATDVAARGIDVNDLTHVVHYNLPEKFENYTHRSGRTGRAGKSGMSISLLSGGDVRRIKQIERVVGATIDQIQVPDGNAICAKQIEQCVQSITNITVDKAVEPYVLQVLEKVGGAVSKESLVSMILGKEINKIMHLYKDAPDINDNAPARTGGYEGGRPSYNRYSDDRNGGGRSNYGDRRRYSGGNNSSNSGNRSNSNSSHSRRPYSSNGGGFSKPASADRG